MLDDEKIKKRTKTAVIHPVFDGNMDKGAYELEEAIGLTEAISLEVKYSAAVNLPKPQPSTLLKSGKVEEVAGLIKGYDIDLCFINSALTPVQQRNLEEKLKCKVIDRSGLILEIFGARAATNEGKLQVELAALEYQRSRVVRSWTHLERQRGGFGFVGGPGEKQIELDKRMINQRINKIKKELSKVVKTRDLHRKQRKSIPYPIIAFVGYTNAGKSTLFNRLTGAKVYADDLLFATLDPTMRQISLPSGRKVILSDTVGFISNLPTELVAAFRATLEEVVEADILLHIRDISNPETESQKEEVIRILNELGLEEKLNEDLIEVLNKVDLAKGRKPKGIKISALSGEGVEKLLEQIDKELAKKNSVRTYKLKPSEGKKLAWLHENAEILEKTTDEEIIKLKVSITEKNIGKFESL